MGRDLDPKAVLAEALDVLQGPVIPVPRALLVQLFAALAEGRAALAAVLADQGVAIEPEESAHDNAPRA